MVLVARGFMAAHILLAIAAPAAAQTMVTTVSGVVGANSSPAADIDTLGLFGPAGGNLNGLTMQVTLKFASALMNEGGASPGYSAWSGPTGTCAVSIGGKPAKPTVQKLAGFDSNRIYFYSDYSDSSDFVYPAGATGDWELAQFVQNSSAPDTCGLDVASTKFHFVPGVALVQAFAYKPALKERMNDYIKLDITVNGIRETVSASVKSLKYAPASSSPS